MLGEDEDGDQKSFVDTDSLWNYWLTTFVFRRALIFYPHVFTDIHFLDYNNLVSTSTIY